MLYSNNVILACVLVFLCGAWCETTSNSLNFEHDVQSCMTAVDCLLRSLCKSQ